MSNFLLVHFLLILDMEKTLPEGQVKLLDSSSSDKSTLCLFQIKDKIVRLTSKWQFMLLNMGTKQVGGYLLRE